MSTYQENLMDENTKYILDCYKKIESENNILEDFKVEEFKVEEKQEEKIESNKILCISSGGKIEEIADNAYDEMMKNVWISDYETSIDAKFLEEHKIDVIINCTKNLRFTNKKGIIKYRVPLNDSPFDINKFIDFLPSAAEFINNCMSEDKNILIHCQCGINRSPTVFAAYLILYEKMKSSDAIDFIRSRRCNTIISEYLDYVLMKLSNEID